MGVDAEYGPLVIEDGVIGRLASAAQRLYTSGRFAPFVYRLGRHPFTVERAVRFR